MPRVMVFSGPKSNSSYIFSESESVFITEN